MYIDYEKQPKKYLRKADRNTRIKLYNAIDDLLELKGDIVKLKGCDYYRLKIPPFRIIFDVDRKKKMIVIKEINTRGDIYK